MSGNNPNDEVLAKQHTLEGPEKEKRELRVSPRRKLPLKKPQEKLGSSSVAPTADLIVEELPPRLFFLDRYPAKTKMNAYSKPEYLSKTLGATNFLNTLTTNTQIVHPVIRGQSSEMV